jgi:hypothetical protein
LSTPMIKVRDFFLIASTVLARIWRLVPCSHAC